jgi:hypothetical protein
VERDECLQPCSIKEDAMIYPEQTIKEFGYRVSNRDSGNNPYKSVLGDKDMGLPR